MEQTPPKTLSELQDEYRRAGTIIANVRKGAFPEQHAGELMQSLWQYQADLLRKMDALVGGSE